MKTETYEIHNGYIQSVGIEADYKLASGVPQIGKRRFMHMDGGKKMMTLNEIKVTRYAKWDEKTGKYGYRFKSVEEWGEFYI